MKWLYDGYWFDTKNEAISAVIELNPYKGADGIYSEIQKIEEFSEEKLARLDLICEGDK